jgi:hypothetical protein
VFEYKPELIQDECSRMDNNNNDNNNDTIVFAEEPNTNLGVFNYVTFMYLNLESQKQVPQMAESH